LLGEDRRLRAREIDKGGVGLDVADALQNGAKSGLASGMRMVSTISPPTCLNRVVNEVSASLLAPSR